jgi:hypothetical protein
MPERPRESSGIPTPVPGAALPAIEPVNIGLVIQRRFVFEQRDRSNPNEGTAMVIVEVLVVH